MTTENGKIKGILEFATKSGPGSILTNPAVLAGAAGLMAQLAMQQTINEITDYLAAIDEKVDDVLRAQKDAVVADLIGVDFVIEEAMTIREQVGLVLEVTWSKVQATSATIARTQAYALRQLDALAGKLERKTAIGDLAKTSRKAEATVQEWLAVLARCFQLQDAIAILELDRVLDATPDELDQHRLGLRIARQNRRLLISQSTERLMGRMDRPRAWPTRRCCCTLLRPRRWCTQPTMSAAPSSTSTPGSGSSRVTSRWLRDDGRTRLPRRGTRCSRREQGASMSPGASVVRPSTGPSPRQGSSPAGLRSEGSIGAGTRLNAPWKAERAAKPGPESPHS